MGTRTHTLRAPPTPEDESWRFEQVPAFYFGQQRDRFTGKSIKFTPEAITLYLERYSVNRVLADDDPSEFILVNFAGFRSDVFRGKVSAEYMVRLFTKGLFLNGQQYRFYHHSNSQLRGRSCFLRRADTDQALDDRIYRMGDFGKIMNIAKRAKRIGLLFSAADIDMQLDPARTSDIRDIKIGNELFSDGCGLISKRLAVQLAKAKRIIFRNQRYTPSVFQIRYRGYKGVLMLHPQLDRDERTHLAQFRDSMKKFTATTDQTFSVVDYSKPYAFGRLNNDIIVLISSLGISNDALKEQQEKYFKWIKNASSDVDAAVDFLSSIGRYSAAERVLLEGLDDPSVQREIKAAQTSEVNSFGKNGKTRVRMMVPKSRLLFGVCDPYGVLEEGEVHVRINAHQGSTTLHEIDVLVVRNPCLHPGDCLKLRAVYRPQLAHLVDCVVFASKGRRAAPSMTSGGDLDGDKFLICWEPSLIPTRLMRSYDYPPNKEHTSAKVTRLDLARHFASYNASGLAKVAVLHQKWARNMPEGAMCPQCQELNALHSQSVDGARVIVPERLLSPPESTEEYVIEILVAEAEKFQQTFTTENARQSGLTESVGLPTEDVHSMITHILKAGRNAMSEHEVFLIAARIAHRHKIDLRPFLPLVDFGALTTEQKHAVGFALTTGSEDDANMWNIIWNSLFRSDILSERDLRQKGLDRPLFMQKLYSSRDQGTAAFFEYMKMAAQDYTRKLVILKTDDRFAAGIFIRGIIPWDEEPEVADNVVVCSFMKNSAQTQRTYQVCNPGYRLHCGDGIFQLYNKRRSDTFIFLNRPPPRSGAFVAASIALQKISASVQRQVGRLNRSPVVEIEIHVVSNRDRVAHQLFDLRFDHVQTEVTLKPQFAERRTFTLNQLSAVKWDTLPEWMKLVFTGNANDGERILRNRTPAELLTVIEFGSRYHLEEQLFDAFHTLLNCSPLPSQEVEASLHIHPPLVFSLLKTFPPDEAGVLPDDTKSFATLMIQTLVRCANNFSMAVLVGLERLAETIRRLALADYCRLLELASLCVRAMNVVQEILLVLTDIRTANPSNTASQVYAHKHVLALVFDRVEEASDECPCDELGIPTKQRSKPSRVRLYSIADDDKHVRVDIRIDLPNSVRLHSLVRLQSASRPEKGWAARWIMDGLVTEARKGELKVELINPRPAEMDDMDWLLFNAGSTATTKAMMDAVQKLAVCGVERCLFSGLIMGQSNGPVDPSNEASLMRTHIVNDDLATLNRSQRAAVNACKTPLSLIWGPPGTGKTTVIIQILRRIIEEVRDGEDKILVTASTHNAVDNILERFVAMNESIGLVQEDFILRVATDPGKVNKKLQAFTVNAQVGDIQQDVKLMTKAQKRVKEARIVFTTCAGAGLGSLRNLDYDIALIDEASQITEPCSLIPLVKGCKRAVLVGDHVQLRPTVRPLAKALEYDRSLLERLYTNPNIHVPKTMLDVQYRFPRELAAFPSEAFYEGRLQTSIENSAAVLNSLASSQFPWPIRNGFPFPVIFVPCTAEEDMGGSSKRNEGQAALAAHIVSLLHSRKAKEAGSVAEEGGPQLDLVTGITALTPYSKQAKTLQTTIPSAFGVSAYTIDSFQGREDDIVVFSTVRCNAAEDIGFVEDARRLNVAWTRARKALIIIGDKRTMTAKSELWQKAIAACVEVQITLPDS